MVLPRVSASSGYTALDEALHAITHGLGIVMAVVGLVFLVLKANASGGALEITAVSIYGGCAVFLYLASTVYHASFNSVFQPFLEVVDHAAIYLKIAGSYTPFALIALPDVTGMAVLITVWVCATIGITLKFVAHYVSEMRRYDWISLASYVGMGWLAVLVAQQLLTGVSLPGFLWLLAGGICFTIGAVFYAWRSRRFTHTIFHVFVLAGSACHFISVYGFVLPDSPA